MTEYGTPSLMASVQRDIEKCDDCKGCEFHKDGCVSERSFLRYCDVFAWAVKRAEHYAEKTGQTAEDVLRGWESNRDYWYMNYYQDCNQPELGDSCKVYEDAEECRNALRGQRFECPHCKKMVSDAQECDKCGWKSYGLFRAPYSVYLKKEGVVIPIFRPGNWNAVGRKSKRKAMKEAGL